MQQNLWGDAVPQPTTKQTSSRSASQVVIHTAADCPIYGHDWQTIGMLGEKKCKACGIVGYCPGCTQVPPANAQPFYCSTHTQLESKAVQQ